MSQIAKVRTSIISGLDAVPVQVEVKIKREGTQFRFQVVGLGDSAIREARERVASALVTAGFQLPKQILVNLAPAELRKEGASLDLAIAAGVLLATQQIQMAPTVFVHGELSLDGSICPIRGTLAHVITAYEAGASAVILPKENLREARLLPYVQTHGVSSLRDLSRILNGESSNDDDSSYSSSSPVGAEVKQESTHFIFSDIWGQNHAKRALTIAAAGGHNLLMQGPPGCGKSMLAKRFPQLLPPLTEEETLETVKIHSIAGRPIEKLLQGVRPLCMPHQGVSQAGLIGGGTTVPCPGDISLAHHGVLFLDELPEFKKSVLEGLRGPLENGNVEIRRAKYGIRFPARFQLIAAMNACPCGRLGAYNQACTCSAVAISNYQQRVSQPIRDRIDLHISLQSVPLNELFPVPFSTKKPSDQEDEGAIKSRIVNARQIQLSRSKTLNAYLTGPALTLSLKLDTSAQAVMNEAMRKLGLSARSYVRLLRVARTIADLAHEEGINDRAIAEALGYREGK
jgi:magnesium chelatase family protein